MEKEKTSKFGFLGDTVDSELAVMITTAVISYNRSLNAPAQAKALICDGAFKPRKKEKGEGKPRKTFLEEVRKNKLEGDKEQMEPWYEEGKFQQNKVRWKYAATKYVVNWLREHQDESKDKAFQKHYELLLENAPETFERTNDIEKSNKLKAYTRVISELNKAGKGPCRKHMEKFKGGNITEIDEMNFRFNTSLPQPYYEFNKKEKGSPRGWNSFTPELKARLERLTWD